jgi:hypothetical protein
MNTKKKYDMNSPDAKAVIDEIVHGTFMTEGTMVAFPLCFPGASVPFPPDESRITALDVTPEGIVYGGTSGYQAHLFVGMFHGVTGAVLDLGIVPEAHHSVRVCCATDKVLLCVNEQQGGQVFSSPYQGLPFDLIQEWGFARSPLTLVASLPEQEILCDAVLNPAGTVLILQGERALYRLDLSSGKLTMISPISAKSRLGRTPQGLILGWNGDQALWQYHPETTQISQQALRLPEGFEPGTHLRYALNPAKSILAIADESGKIYGYTDDKGFSQVLTQAPLEPVTALAVTFDGRIYGSCGDGIGRLFGYNPWNRETKNLGVAVSTLQQRRYGYEFGDAVTGRDGQIYFGENDNNGHLWIYFPKVQSLEAPTVW